MSTPNGFATVSLELGHVLVSRKAFVTFGLNPGATTGSQIPDAMKTAWTYAGSLKSITDSDVTLSGVRVSVGSDTGEDVVYQGVYAEGGGLAAASTLPANCAVLVHKRTVRGGRRGRGRFFYPWCVTETNVDEAGRIGASPVTTMQTAFTVFLNKIVADGFQMVLLHKPSLPGTEHPTTPGSPDVVTSLVVDPLISTQRRRLGRK